MTPNAQFTSMAWNQLWQVTALVLLVGIASRACCRRRPHLAYVLWVLVLVKCVTPPVVSSQTGVFCWAGNALATLRPEAGGERVAAREPATTGKVGGPLSAAAAEVAPADTDFPRTETRTQPLVSVHEDSSTDNRDLQASASWLVSLSTLDGVLGIVWIAGVLLFALFFLARHIVGVVVVRRWQVAVDGELRALVDEVARRVGLPANVRVVVTRRGLGPAVFGVLRPTVLLPQQMLKEHSREQIELILAHELIHVRRHDTLIGLLQEAAQILWWFHPLVWWANRQVTFERERCCDDEVVAGTRYAAAEYAQTLLDVLKSTRRPRLLAGLPGIRPVDFTRKRLERIMQDEKRHPHMPRAYWLVFLGLVLLFVPGAALSFQEASGQKKAPVAQQPPEAGDAAAAASDVASEEAKAATGTLSGRIRFVGTPPELPPLIKKGDAKVKDAAVCSAEDIPDERLLVGRKGGLKNVFIYLAKAPQGYVAGAEPADAVAFDRVGCRFVPHAMVVRTGQKVRIVNSDAIASNVHAFPLRNPPFNQVIAPKDREGGTLLYKKPESTPVRIGSDFHAWMKAWQLPLDHPFAAVTDAKGKFEIKNLPVGTHEFRVWHEEVGYLEKQLVVEVTAGKRTKVNLKYTAERFEKDFP